MEREGSRVGEGGIDAHVDAADRSVGAERGDALSRRRRRAGDERGDGSSRADLRGASEVGGARGGGLAEERLDDVDEALAGFLAGEGREEVSVSHAVVDDGVGGVDRGVEELVDEGAVTVVDEVGESAVVAGDADVGAGEVGPRLGDARVDAVFERRDEGDVAGEMPAGGLRVELRDDAREQG